MGSLAGGCVPGLLGGHVDLPSARRRVAATPIRCKHDWQRQRLESAGETAALPEAAVAQVLADDLTGAGQQPHEGLALVAERARPTPVNPASRWATSLPPERWS